LEIDVAAFFANMPEAQPLYEMLAEKMREEYPSARIKIQKSQISFSGRHNFAFVWLPLRPVKTRPPVYIVVSFGLPRHLESPRIVQAVEPYPNRWTHHVIVQSKDDIDPELLGWIREAYIFADGK